MTERDVTELGPIEAIQQSIYDLIRERAAWKDRDDPDGVKPLIEAQIACLYQAQRELAELREIKKALKVLKGVL